MMTRREFAAAVHSLKSQGFRQTASVMADRPEDGGVFFQHDDGRECVIRESKLVVLKQADTV